MASAALVLVDTCMWVPFFSRKKSDHKATVERLVEENRAAIIGPVLAEVLLGFKKEREADWVASALEGIHWFEVEWEDWRRAAALGRKLAASGHLLPLSDLAVAAVALRRQLKVYSIDPHFDLIPELDRFPEKE